MSTTYYGYSEFDSDQTAVEAELSTFAQMVDEDLYTLSGTITLYSDHSNLSNLSYALSGHTGFASSADLTTVSGQLVTHKSSSDHDGRYYTETETNTISGALSSEIDSDIIEAFSDGIDAWIDDGVNFRATFSGGLLVDVTATVSGGYQIL